MQGWSTGRTLSVVRDPPSLPPLPSKSPVFSGFVKEEGEVPITIQASPLVLSQNTPKGDEWVEEEGLVKMLSKF